MKNNVKIMEMLVKYFLIHSEGRQSWTESFFSRIEDIYKNKIK